MNDEVEDLVFRALLRALEYFGKKALEEGIKWNQERKKEKRKKLKKKKAKIEPKEVNGAGK